MTEFDADHYFDTTFEDLELHAVDLSGKEFERCTFRRCKLPESRWARVRLEDCVIACSKEPDFTRATGVFFDPAQNRVKGVRISLEAAVTLVGSYGIVVE